MMTTIIALALAAALEVAPTTNRAGLVGAIVAADSDPRCVTSWQENLGYPHSAGPYVYRCGDAEGNPID